MSAKKRRITDIAKPLPSKEISSSLHMNDSSNDSHETPESSLMNLDIQSLCKTRAEEKEILRSLARRLDYYILRQRELEASSYGVRAENDKASEEARTSIEELRVLQVSQQEAATKTQNRLIAEITVLNKEQDKLSRQVADLTAELSKSTDDKKRLQDRLKKATDELGAVEKKNLTLVNELKALQHSTLVHETTIKSLQTQLEATRGEVKKERDLRFAAESNVQKNEPNYKHEVELLRKKLTEMSDERDQWSKTLENEKLKCKDEYSEKMKKFMAEEQLRVEEDKDRLANELRALFKERETDYIADIKALEASKSRLEEEILANTNSLQALKRTVTDLTTSRDALSVEISALRDEVNSQRAQYLSEIAEKTEMAKRSEQRYLSKSFEFNALMDVKVRLAMEIKRYRELMLSAEDIEQQFELQTEQDTTSKIVIISMDAELGEIHFKNGTTEQINLDNWKLYSKKTRKEFSFPRVVVNPSQSFKVYFGPNASKHQKKDKKDKNSVSFAVTDVFADVDTAVLADGRGKEVTRVDIN